jgi:hypothetical protein
MKSRLTPHQQLQATTKSVAGRPLPDPISLLEGELVRARERARAAEERSHDLERELGCAKAQAADETRALRERSAVLAERLLATLRALVETRAEARAERRLLRLEVALLEMHGLALEAMCRELLLAIKRARRSAPDLQARAQVPPHAQGSA